MGWRGNEVSMPDCTGKATIHHEWACCHHSAEMGFVFVYTQGEFYLQSFFSLFEILYLKWKENDRLAELKMEVQLNGIFWGMQYERDFTS